MGSPFTSMVCYETKPGTSAEVSKESASVDTIMKVMAVGAGVVLIGVAVAEFGNIAGTLANIPVGY